MEPRAYRPVDPRRATAWFFRVLAHERDLRAFLARSLAHEADVSDVVQETYARLLALSPERRRAVRSWRPFLFTAARNIAMDHLRRREILSLVSLESLPEMNGPDVVARGGDYGRPDEIVNSTQERDLLARVIVSLPVKCRQVLMLRKIHDMSHREIALRLGIAEHTVEKHVSHGVRLCAERLLEAAGHTHTERHPSYEARADEIG